MNEDLEKAAKEYKKNFNTSDGYEDEDFINGASWMEDRMYTEEDMIAASKYGYDFHKTSQFPAQVFKESCINNTKQWLTTFNKIK